MNVKNIRETVSAWIAETKVKIASAIDDETDLFADERITPDDATASVDHVLDDQEKVLVAKLLEINASDEQRTIELMSNVHVGGA